jgi:hypothetical protein
LEGLFVQSGGKWTRIDERPVKEMAQSEKEVWVLFGDGSVDKIDPEAGRLYFDVLAGSVKRPWASSMAVYASNAMFGGFEGWCIKSPSSVSERVLPDLEGDVVTALASNGNSLCVGSQKHGLFAVSGSRVTRFGFAKGLLDTWVTALHFRKNDLWIGLAEKGLMRLNDGNLQPISECPIRRVRKMTEFRGRLLVGGMDGVAVLESGSWKRVQDAECTALSVVGGEMMIGTPERAFRVR